MLKQELGAGGVFIYILRFKKCQTKKSMETYSFVKQFPVCPLYSD